MIDVRLELRVAVGALGQYEHGLDVLLPAEALARELGDRRRLGWVCAALCMMSTQSDRDEQARRFGGTALALGRELNDPGLQAVARNYLTTIAFNLGEPVTVVNYARETIALLPETLTRDRLGQAILPSVSALHWMARGLAQLGAFDEGITHARRAIELAETVDHPYSAAVAWAALGHLYTERGDFDQARAWLERSLAQCRNLGFRAFRGRTSLHLGEVHARAGHLTEALSLLDEASEMFVAVGRSREGLILTARAEAYLYGGRLDEARACAERALAWARGRGQRAFEPGADYVLGLIASRSDTPEIGMGTQHLQRARAVAGEFGRRPLVAHCHLGLGKLYRRTDNREQAQEHLTSATAMYREMGMTYWLEQAGAELK
jgi:tetratricopeptide (TPR) repeat protein